MKHLTTIFALTLIWCLGTQLNAQLVKDFTSLPAVQANKVIQYPEATHSFQIIIRAGDPLTAGGVKGAVSDFTGFVPENGSSTRGHLAINSEFLDLDALERAGVPRTLINALINNVDDLVPNSGAVREIGGGGVAVLHIQYDPTSKLWVVDSSGNVDFSSFGGSGTGINCSGAITPWETSITCEEIDPRSIPSILGLNLRDLNSDGRWDLGWCTEIDVKTRKIKDYDGDGKPDKIWGLGTMAHENVSYPLDSVTLYFGEDDGSDQRQSQFLYKYVADQPGNLGSGKLYVLVLDPNDETRGNWVLVPNTTLAEQQGVEEFAKAQGAWFVPRVEDVEINPVDRSVWVISTNWSQVIRYEDNGMTVENIEIWVDNVDYEIDLGNGQKDTVLFSKPDNGCFDNEGNFWVTQDGGQGYLYLVHNDHTPANPHVSIFGSFPFGSEPTGMTLSPDGRFIFVSIQHPSESNDEEQIDAAGCRVKYDLDVTVVFARKELLGNGEENCVNSVSERMKPGSFYINKMFPNPTSEFVTVNLHSLKNQTIKVEINNNVGYTVREYTQTLSAGNNSFQVRMDDLLQGLYFVTLRSEDGVLTERILKLNK
jgi:secreted PhoX family phosphatase